MDYKFLICQPWLRVRGERFPVLSDRLCENQVLTLRQTV